LIGAIGRACYELPLIDSGISATNPLRNCLMRWHGVAPQFALLSA